jgi:hypothetical protein
VLGFASTVEATACISENDAVGRSEILGNSTGASKTFLGNVVFSIRKNEYRVPKLSVLSLVAHFLYFQRENNKGGVELYSSSL